MRGVTNSAVPALLALILAGCQTTGQTAGAGRLAQTTEQAVRLCIDSATLPAGSPAAMRANCDRAIGAGAEAGAVLADMLNARAIARAALHDLDGALADRRQAAEIDPGSAFRLRELGWGLIDRNRNDEALATFDAALAIAADNTEGLAGRAAALRGLGRFDEALEAAGIGRALAPAENFFLREIAWSHYGAGRPAVAEIWFRKAVEADGADAWALYGLGWVLDDLERHGEALAVFDRAIEIDATVPLFHSLRGNTLNNLGRHDEALAEAELALGIYSGDAVSHRVRGLAFRGLGRLDKAVEAFTDAIEAEPEDDLAHFGLAAILSDLNQTVPALAHARRAVGLNSASPHGWYLLGYLQMNAGDPAPAIESFRAALRLDAGYSAARYDIATANAMLGRGAASLEALAEALGRDPNPDHARGVVSALLNAGLTDTAARAARMISGAPGLARA